VFVEPGKPWALVSHGVLQTNITEEIDMTTKGTLVAAAVAGLFMSATPMVSSARAEGKVHCMGVNSCKGNGACKGADNACKGQNSCKGKGFIEMSEKDCKAKGGTSEKK
jgi:hypothetical protein